MLLRCLAPGSTQIFLMTIYIDFSSVYHKLKPAKRYFNQPVMRLHMVLIGVLIINLATLYICLITQKLQRESIWAKSKYLRSMQRAHAFLRHVTLTVIYICPTWMENAPSSCLSPFFNVRSFSTPSRHSYYSMPLQVLFHYFIPC